MLLYSMWICWHMQTGGMTPGFCAAPWHISDPVSVSQCHDDLRTIKGLPRDGLAYCRATWIKRK